MLNNLFNPVNKSLSKEEFDIKCDNVFESLKVTPEDILEVKRKTKDKVTIHTGLQFA